MKGMTDIFGNLIEIGDLVASTQLRGGGYTKRTSSELAIYEIIGFTPQKIRVKCITTDKITTKFGSQVCLGEKKQKVVVQPPYNPNQCNYCTYTNSLCARCHCCSDHCSCVDREGYRKFYSEEEDD